MRRRADVEALGTIGVYGRDEASFYSALTAFGCDCLVDIRQRRGVRGARYAFANRGRLEEGCHARQLAYMSIAALAPTRELRDLQIADDHEAKEAKSDRRALGSGFIGGYEALLGDLNVVAISTKLAVWARPALLCVEATPDACHRSLAADWLVHELGVSVTHL